MNTIYQVRTKGEKDWRDVSLVQYQACGCSDHYENRMVCLDITEAHGRLQQENNDLRHEVERLINVAQGAEAWEMDWPEYSHDGMGCGLEDRNITDRYDAMKYGWGEAIERVGQILERDGPLFAAPPAQTALTDDARNLVTLDRRDLWDHVRGAIHAALNDKIPKDCVVSWAWEEATNRTMDIFQKIVDTDPAAQSASGDTQ